MFEFQTIFEVQTWINVGISFGISIAIFIPTMIILVHFAKGAKAYFIGIWVFIGALIILAILFLFEFSQREMAKEIIWQLAFSFTGFALLNTYWHKKELRKDEKIKEIENEIKKKEIRI